MLTALVNKNSLRASLLASVFRIFILVLSVSTWTIRTYDSESPKDTKNKLSLEIN